MALDFKGGDAANNSEELKERLRYSNYMNALKSNFSIRDTLYDNKYYGFLNKDYKVIQPVSGTDFVNFGEYAVNTFGLNFVVDQFNEFRDFYFNFNNESGNKPPALVQTLTPGKSFENFDQGHQKHISSILLKLGIELRKLSNIRTINRMLSPVEFYNHFAQRILFSPVMEGFNISKSGYAISSKSTVYETGIYVDLAENISTDLDYEKGRMLEDPGFLCYLTFVSDYGFSVDFNAPWRLILNLEHPKTMKNILNGRNMADYWNFYYDQYVESTGFSYDYYNIREFYETLYKEYYKVYNRISREEMARIDWRTIYQNMFLASIEDTPYGPGQFWVEYFTLNRLREVGMIQKYETFEDSREVLRIREHALRIYGQEQVSSNGITLENRISTGKIGEPDTGISAYITTVCAEHLKRKLTESDK